MDFAITDMYPGMADIFSTTDATVPDEDTQHSLVDEDASSTIQHGRNKHTIFIGVLIMLAFALFLTH